ncbi:histidine kinase [Pseudoflavitalea sp. G-6-1-2]|uniref:sensor histidine kinase n=1 Tax=Pseudoflavitalea sp. G-6-1-2 TaxID=2728841 RepID=UPI00146EE5DA|nr:histidine kinase [Pseudoflavitalea sp. G-6-1-2]NML22632.1 histidine kinase [Pseudoflavitalea sp. G-6-1-2]
MDIAEKGVAEIPLIRSGTLWYQFLISSRFRWLRHGLLYLLFLFIMMQPDKEDTSSAADSLLLKLAFTAYCIGLIYLNAYVLVPKYLAKGKLAGYLIMALLTGTFTFLVVCIAKSKLPSENASPSGQDLLSGYLTFLILYSIVIAASASIKLFQKWVKSVEHYLAIQQLNFRHELGLLKSQINPHFLFNTLNNVHVLIQDDPKRASGMVLNLSALLRYQIYDCGEENVSLAEDIGFLHDFLTLEQSRRDDFSFEIKRTGNLTNIQIPPMMFIPFVENAVKHNHDPDASSYVNLSIDLKHNRLQFRCENSKPAGLPMEKGSVRGGIGLANIRRRLNLLFPSKYELNINNTEHSYHVDLQLIL